MEDKKTFFSSLNPKSAMIVGTVAGFLILCTIGFIVLASMMISGRVGNKISSSITANTTVKTPVIPAVTAPTKASKPVVELFIMSYCPYGLQMQKAYLPVMKLFGKKADFSVKWVNYIMHGKKEIDENNAQYCIQKEQSDKYLIYAECFAVSGNSATCSQTAKIDENKMKSCVSAADSKFGITDSYNATSTWLSERFPIYKVHDDLNKKYGVQGSPTLVINGQEIEGVSRTPESLKQVICSSFTTQPAECKTTLSSSAATAGFGAGTGSDTAGVDCGT